MENQRQFLVMGLMAICMVLYFKWVDFTAPQIDEQATVQNIVDHDTTVPSNGFNGDVSDIPSTPGATNIPASTTAPQKQDYITVTTDLTIVKINTFGGVIESLELLDEPVSLDEPNVGFALLKKNNEETFISEDGLLAIDSTAPNHTQTQYSSSIKNYNLGDAEKISVPLTWTSNEGIEYVKTIHFSRDSYVIDIDYQVNNRTEKPWSGFLYGQFSRSKPKVSGGFFSSFGRLPSHVGPAIYDDENGYDKISFGDIEDGSLALKTNEGWVAMLQHYFVGAWIPAAGEEKEFYTGVTSNKNYRVGYKTTTPVTIAPNQTGKLSAKVYIGSKQQSRLKAIQKESNVKGLALTVDYGFLTFIADPLFVVLSFINDIVGNWGWAIIILTLLIKVLFYPLSAKGFKSMAKMRKFSPRLKTLKERYKDDRQKYQMEMMALYKKEKINPVGGCLPILIQMPVFLALYWVLLESVEMRHAPFALWLQDLSAPDPWLVLPVLMGASMWLQQKMNPAPMDEIQQKVMMIMPIALVIIFINFPQGLVLYWTVNNLLTIAQQWLIYRQFDE